MVEAFNLRDQFQGWLPELRNKRVSALIEVVNRHAVVGIVSVIQLEPYNRIFVGKLNPAFFDRPYFLSFYGIMARLISSAHQGGIADKVEFIFDDQSGQETAILASYDQFVEVAPPQMKQPIGARPVHRDDEKFLPLQAADLLGTCAAHISKDGGAETLTVLS